MSFLGDLFGNDAAEEAAKAKAAGLKSAYGKAEGILTPNYQSAIQYLQPGMNAYGGIYDTASQGLNAYANATGLNGQSGYDQAFANFRADPGYQYQLDQANEAVMRKAASTGQLASGDTLQQISNTTRNLADQGYNNYINRLLPYLNLSTTAASGLQGSGNSAASLTQNYGNTLANYGYNSEAGIGDANASAALAKQSGAANLFDAITGGLSLASKVIGFL